MKSLENSDIISELCEVIRTGKTRRTAADHGNLMAVRWRYNRLCTAVLTAPVCSKALQLSDSYRLALDAEDAASLALRLLRAYASADCRQRRVFSQHLCSLGEIAGSDLGDELRDLDAYRASSHAARVLAVETS